MCSKNTNIKNVIIAENILHSMCKHLKKYVTNLLKWCNFQVTGNISRERDRTVFNSGFTSEVFTEWKTVHVCFLFSLLLLPQIAVLKCGQKDGGFFGMSLSLP